MLRLIEAFFPERAPVKVKRMTCSYQVQKEGVFADLEFQVTAEKGVEAVEFTFVLFDIFDVFLGSIDLKTRKPINPETAPRGDVCAIESAGCILEAVVALELARAHS